MDIRNIKNLLILIGVTLIASSSSCKKDSSKPCANFTPYNFNVTSNILPEQNTYAIGDTIYLNSSFPVTLLNTVTNQQVNYTNSLGVGGTITFSMADTIAKRGKDAFDKFLVLSQKGSFVQISNTPNSGIAQKYKEDSGIFEFQIAIVLKQKGIFWLGVNDLGSQGLRGNNCTNASFNMTVTNANKHIDLFQYALNYMPDAYIVQHIYCFRVN